MTSQTHRDAASDGSRVSLGIRESLWSEGDTAAVSALVRAYLLQTEAEKHEHGRAESSAPLPLLPPRYEPEVRDPQTAYTDCTTLLADVEQRPAGVVIARVDGGGAEIKRLWADPDFRGLGVGSALLDAALKLTSDQVRLSVWEWRTAAISLYESRGFERVDSWDDRGGLLCMVRPANTLLLR